MTVLGEDDMLNCIEGEDGLSVERQVGSGLSIQPASMDVHLGDKFKQPTQSHNATVSVDDKETYPNYSSFQTPRPVIEAGKFVLATTEERVRIPNDKIALLHGRSSVGRLGLFIENAGLIDPGFNGQVTLELFNPTDYDIELVAGMGIGQLTFHDVKTAPEVGYSEYNGNKYDGQMGPTVSQLWKDFE